ncbi:hypothetical protein PSP6_170129 [Paraburkholderia tropica]|nr:hypothetical protein PSP6_170129 [Paraburkholderia tropica]
MRRRHAPRQPRPMPARRRCRAGRVRFASLRLLRLFRFSLLVDEVKLGDDAGGCAHAILLWCNFPLSRILTARSRYGNYGNYRSCFRFRVEEIDKSMLRGRGIRRRARCVPR